MEITPQQLEALESNTGYNNQYTSLLKHKEEMLGQLTSLYVNEVITGNLYTSLADKLHKKTEKKIYELKLRAIEILKL